MAINKALAEVRGISEENQKEIEGLHSALEKLINSAIDEQYPDVEEIAELIHRTENKLQTLWKFSVNRDYHTWAFDYLRRVNA